jgi:hypothetical protein
LEPLTTTARSWRAEPGKKMVWRRRAERSALRMVPPSTMPARPTWRSTAMRAPNLARLRYSEASVMASTTEEISPGEERKNGVSPRRTRARRSSGWKMTTRATANRARKRSTRKARRWKESPAPRNRETMVARTTTGGGP